MGRATIIVGGVTTIVGVFASIYYGSSEIRSEFTSVVTASVTYLCNANASCPTTFNTCTMLAR